MNVCLRSSRGCGSLRRLLPVTNGKPPQSLMVARPQNNGHHQSLVARHSSRFAAVDHSQAYENAMNGRHGQQLALAKLEGIGKDDAPFDPFIEEELAELAALEGNDGEDDADDIEEAELVGDSDDELEEEDDEFEDSMYNPDGSVPWNKSTLAALRAGYPAGGMLAAIELGGSQHKVTTDDVIVVNRLKPVDKYKVGSVHTLSEVMLVGSSHMTLVGLPYVKGAEVDVLIEEITQDAKLTIFKKRRRKNSQRKNGFRRDVTLLRVTGIRMPEEMHDHEHVGRDELDDLDANNETPNQLAQSA